MRPKANAVTTADTFLITTGLLWLLVLRRANQVIQQLALLHDFDTGVVLNGAEVPIDLRQIGAPLRIDIAHDVGHSQRELTLLAALAVVEERVDSPHQLGIVDRRHGPRRLDGDESRGGLRGVELAPQ